MYIDDGTGGRGFAGVVAATAAFATASLLLPINDALKATAVLRRRYRMRYRLFKLKLYRLLGQADESAQINRFPEGSCNDNNQQSTVEIEMGVEN